MSDRINLNLSRRHAAVLYGILSQAIDESTGDIDGLLIEEGLEVAVKIRRRVWDLLQPKTTGLIRPFLSKKESDDEEER